MSLISSFFSLLSGGSTQEPDDQRPEGTPQIIKPVICAQPLSPIKEVNSLGKNEILPASDHLRVIIILDESSSMGTIKNSMRNSINDFLVKQQKDSVDNTTFTLVKFSDFVRTTIDNVPINEVKLLTERDYVPSGCTALNDAIGLTIERFSLQSNVIMVIVTDGAENVSQYYTNGTAIKQLIGKYKHEKQWNFVYLSCDADTFGQGQNLGFAASAQSSNICYDKLNMANFMSGRLSDAVSQQRSTGQKVNDSLNN